VTRNLRSLAVNEVLARGAHRLRVSLNPLVKDGQQNEGEESWHRSERQHQCHNWLDALHEYRNNAAIGTEHSRSLPEAPWPKQSRGLETPFLGHTAMSFAIVILLDTGAVVFTDSRSVESESSKSENGVRKTAVLSCNGGHTVVAFTGEGKINGKLTLNILAESVAGNEGTDFAVGSLVKGLEAAFAEDMANYAWKSQAEKETYLRDAKVILHILTAPKTHSLWEVTPRQSKNVPVQDYSLSGVKSVECLKVDRHWDLSLVRSLVPKSIDKICKTERSCGYPVDVTVWKLAGEPQPLRCPDLNALDKHLASLSM
jgi:hypothetical protein